MDEKHLSNVSFTEGSVNEKPDAPGPTPNVLKAATLPLTAPNQDGSFFPWLEVDNQKFSAKNLSRFPVMGAVGLIGSALTVVLSFLVLYFFNKTPIVTGHLPAPAAWLSIILSINSVCVHIAVTHGREGKFVQRSKWHKANFGRTVTWWVRATKTGTTVADLHYIWATDHYLLDAITQWKAFNYILLATILVATLPANGIILQNAVSSQSMVANLTDASTNYSIADHLPAGMTATIDPDGSMDLYRYDWQQAMPLVIGNYDLFFKQSLDTNTTCKGYCEAVVRGIGFVSHCEESVLLLDLPLDQQQNLPYTPYNQSAPSINYTLFEIGIAWDHTTPNGWNLTTIWKNDSLCSSNIVKSTCQIQLGSINYPVAVSFNGSNDGKYDWSLHTNNLTNAGDVSDPSLDFSSFGKGTVETVHTNSTYGGIATALATYFNSSITFNRDNIHNTTELKVNGFYAEQLNTLIDEKSLDYRCNISLNYFGHDGFYHTPYTDLLEQFRYWLFYVSVYAMEPNTTIWTAEQKPTPQIVYNDLDEVHVTIYVVHWSWYFGSLGITLAIVLIILPMYYGFWTLGKLTSLSPFETARAFQTPILQDQPMNLDTPDLLKTVGKKNLRTELSSPPNSPMVERNFGNL